MSERKKRIDAGVKRVAPPTARQILVRHYISLDAQARLLFRSDLDLIEEMATLLKEEQPKNA